EAGHQPVFDLVADLDRGRAIVHFEETSVSSSARRPCQGTRRASCCLRTLCYAQVARLSSTTCAPLVRTWYGTLVLHVAVPEDLEWLDDAARRGQKNPPAPPRGGPAGPVKTPKKARAPRGRRRAPRAS